MEFVICRSRACVSSHPCVLLKYSGTEISILSWISLAVLAEDPKSGLSPALPQEVQEPLCTSALCKLAVGNSEIQFLTLELFLL